MRQAIEEGFILDVLKNYITYELYFKLTKAIEDDPNLNKKKWQKPIGWNEPIDRRGYYRNTKQQEFNQQKVYTNKIIVMKSIIELIQLLQTVLVAEHQIKQELIKEFQDEVWNDESIQDETLNEILSQLAYDLDFYVA